MNIRNLLVFLVILLINPGLTGCDNSNDAAPELPPEVISFDIEPKISVLDIGTSESFKALVTYSDGAVTDVSDAADWKLENQSGIIEPQDNPDDNGLLFALAVKAGADKLVATIDGMSTSSSVTVVDALLVSLEVTPTETSMPIGTEVTFTAEGTYDDGHVQDLTEESDWTAFDGSTANVVTITGKGIVSGVNEGTVKIKASSTGVESNPANITVHDPKEIVLIDVSPAYKLMFTGSAQQFTAHAYYSDGSIDFITNSALWLSSDTSVVAQDLYRKGQFNAQSTGSAVISAELGLGNEGTAFVDVKEVEVESIVVTPRDTEVSIGQTRRYFTEAILSDGSQPSINNSDRLYYSIGDSSVAYISNNPENKGELTGLAAGSTTIRSTFIYEGETFTDETTVNIIP